MCGVSDAMWLQVRCLIWLLLCARLEWRRCPTATCCCSCRCRTCIRISAAWPSWRPQARGETSWLSPPYPRLLCQPLTAATDKSNLTRCRFPHSRQTWDLGSDAESKTSLRSRSTIVATMATLQPRQPTPSQESINVKDRLVDHLSYRWHLVSCEWLNAIVMVMDIFSTRNSTSEQLNGSRAWPPWMR